MNLKLHIDYELSDRIARMAWDCWCRCYHIAFAALMLSELENAYYVEGSITFLQDYPQDGHWTGRVFQHAWLELGDRIIDPQYYQYKLAYHWYKRVNQTEALQAYRDNGGHLPLFLPEMQLI